MKEHRKGRAMTDAMSYLIELDYADVVFHCQS